MSVYADALVLILYWIAIGLVAMGALLFITFVALLARDAYERLFPKRRYSPHEIQDRYSNKEKYR